MGGAWKIAVTLLAAACAALALSACGGGSDTTTSPAVELGTSGTSERGSGANSGGNGESKSGGGEGKSSHPGGANQEEPEEEESSGGGNDERSATFRTPGGDNSIQNYGDEGDAGERAKATKTITLFFKSSEAEKWATVCGLLSSKNLSALKQFSEKMKTLNGKGCPEVLALVMTKTQGKPPEAIKGGVIALRVKGGVSFALYHGINGKNYAFPLKLEGGEWKLTGLAPTPLSF